MSTAPEFHLTYGYSVPLEKYWETVGHTLENLPNRPDDLDEDVESDRELLEEDLTNWWENRVRECTAEGQPLFENPTRVGSFPLSDFVIRFPAHDMEDDFPPYVVIGIPLATFSSFRKRSLVGDEIGRLLSPLGPEDLAPLKTHPLWAHIDESRAPEILITTNICLCCPRI